MSVQVLNSIGILINNLESIKMKNEKEGKKMFKKKRKRDIKECVLITSLGKLCMGQRSPHIKGLVVMQTETIKAVTSLPERTWLLCF